MPRGGKTKGSGRPTKQVGNQLDLFGNKIKRGATKKRSHELTVDAKSRKKEEANRKTRNQQMSDLRRQERTEQQNREREEAAEGIVALQDAFAITPLPTAGAQAHPVVDGDDDDDGYDSDCGEDYKDHEDETTEQGKRESARYKPPRDSKLGKYLADTKELILGEDNNLDKRKGKVWYPPTMVPTTNNPHSYCSATAWVYHFDPFGADGRKAGKPLKEHQCIKCKRFGYLLQSNGWHYRPQHNFQTVDWILHRRLKCRNDRSGKGCGGTFAEFHPDFMAQLPTVIAEKFPYLVTPSGLGIHQAMMEQFLPLSVKGILFGTYCSSINEMKMTEHWRTHCNYLDLLSDTMKIQTSMVPKPFFSYKSIGYYNGIKFRPSLLRKLFLQIMGSWETYLQESFQMHPDESESSDHTFKFVKMIAASKRAGKVFLASYDSISLAGMCTFNRLVHTKSNDELLPLFQLHKQVRINAGADTLKRVEGDGGGDRSLWRLVFKELKSKVKPYVPASMDGLPLAGIDEERFVVMDSCTEVNTWARAMGDALVSCEGDIHFGLDAENNIDETREITRVITICLPESLHNKVLVLDLTRMSCFDSTDFPQALKLLLQNPRMMPVAVNIAYDCKRLEDLGVTFRRRVELMDLGKELHLGRRDGYGLKSMCKRVLNLYVDKEHQRSDWREMKDNKDLQKYAALDCYLHLSLFQELTNSIALGRSRGDLPITRQYTLGQRVKLTHRKKTVALGTLQFVGGVGGEARSWGTLTVGRNKSLVMVDSVTSCSHRPAFPFKKTPEDSMDSWDNQELTLKEAYDKHKVGSGFLIAWPTDRVQVQLESVVHHMVTPAGHPLATEEEKEEEKDSDTNEEVSLVSGGLVPL